MAISLSKVHYLSRRIATNPIHSWKQKSFHTNHGLFSQSTFSEKPAWLKKFKLKQAAFQKDDGRPTFLKKGIPDKILFNLTLGGVIFGFFMCFKVMENLKNLPK